MALALVAMVVYAAGNVGLMALIKPIFDNVLPRNEDLGLIAALILGTYLAKGLGSYVSSFLMTDVGQRVVRDVRNALFRHTLDQSAAFFSRRTSGQLVSRITNDVNQVQAAAETVTDLIRESLAVVGYIALLFYYDWSMALVFLTAAPLIVYALVRLGQRVRRVSRRGQEDIEHVTHIATEGLAGHRIVKAFGAEGREAERFGRASDQLYRTNMKITAALSALPPIMELIGGAAFVGALWYGARRVQGVQGDPMSQGEFVGFLITAFAMYTPIKKLSRVNASLQQAIAAAQRILSCSTPTAKSASGRRPVRSRPSGKGSNSATSDLPTTMSRSGSRCVT
jgi:subfamily B ATP-binding cassette protein MsbA